MCCRSVWAAGVDDTEDKEISNRLSEKPDNNIYNINIYCLSGIFVIPHTGVYISG